MEIRARDGDVAVLTGKDFDLAVPHVARQPREAGQRQRPAVERMGGVGDGDFPLACFRDKRGITLGGVSRFPAAPSRARGGPHE